MIDLKRKRTCHRTLLCEVMLLPPHPFQVLMLTISPYLLNYPKI